MRGLVWRGRLVLQRLKVAWRGQCRGGAWRGRIKGPRAVYILVQPGICQGARDGDFDVIYFS